MKSGMRALVPVALGTEDIEFVGITDVLSRAGIDVVVATVEAELEVRLMKGIRVMADYRLDDVGQTDFDVVVIPGGVPGAMRLGESQRLRDMLVRLHGSGAWVAGICLAPAVVLWPTGLLEPCKRLTGNPLPIQAPGERFAPDEFTKRFGDRFDPSVRVWVDEEHRMITSQSPGTTIEFALAIVGVLCGAAEAQKVADYLLV